MKTFIEYYNELNEEKLIKRKQKNEEEIVSGGELTEPTNQSQTNDILTTKPNNSIGTEDILGKCDHQHSREGFFGPGCFHLAKNVFNKIDKRYNISADFDTEKYKKQQ